jgi:hypothetical protein
VGFQMRTGRDWTIVEGDEVTLTSTHCLDGRFVRPEEAGVYRHDGHGLVRVADGYELPRPKRRMADVQS